MNTNENEPLTCLSAPGDEDYCKGPVELRPPMSPTGKWFPRCDAHFAARLDTQARIVREYGGQTFYYGGESDSYGEDY